MGNKRKKIRGTVDSALTNGLHQPNVVKIDLEAMTKLWSLRVLQFDDPLNRVLILPSRRIRGRQSLRLAHQPHGPQLYRLVIELIGYEPGKETDPAPNT